MIQGNTKQIASNLRLSVGERTEIALNVRTDDGMTNGAGNVVKKIQLIGVIWVQFDHSDVGERKPDTKIEIFIFKVLSQHGHQ